MLAITRTHRSLLVLAALALLWMGVDWGDYGCEAAPRIVSER
jgi:hypothetical protein